MKRQAALFSLGILAGICLVPSAVQARNILAVPVNYTNAVERNWRQEKEAEIRDAVTYRDLRDGMNANRTISSAALESRYSGGLIGSYIYTRDQTKVARIEDVILDKFGNAQKIVLRGEWPYDMDGNPVVLGYDDVIDVNATANQPSVVKAVSIDQLKAAPVFNGVIGGDEAMISFFPGADVKDSAGNPVALVENVSFSRNTGAYFILSYGQGGDSGQALLAYKDVQKVISGRSVYLQLTAAQTDFFRKNLLKNYAAPQNITSLPH